jgi:hypothetical protein
VLTSDPTNGVVMYLRLSQSWLRKSFNYGGVTPCSPVEVHDRFGGPYKLHLRSYCNLLLAGDTNNKTILEEMSHAQL